jgi:hypothetical protein
MSVEIIPLNRACIILSAMTGSNINIAEKRPNIRDIKLYTLGTGNIFQCAMVCEMIIAIKINKLPFTIFLDLENLSINTGASHTAMETIWFPCVKTDKTVPTNNHRYGRYLVFANSFTLSSIEASP